MTTFSSGQLRRQPFRGSSPNQGVPFLLLVRWYFFRIVCGSCRDAASPSEGSVSHLEFELEHPILAVS